MNVDQYSKVRITTPRFESEGVPVGTVGWVIEIHQDKTGPAYEVEVMDDQGRTQAMVVVRENELQVLPGS